MGKFFLSLFMGLWICFSSFAQKGWKEDDYEKYNFKSFEKYAPAQEVIDLKKMDITLLNAAIFYATNKVRKQKKLPLFQHFRSLEKAASGHAKDMAKMDFFSHTSKIKKKKTLIDRLALVGMKNVGCAENIAFNMGYPVDGKAFYPPSVNGGYFSFEVKGKPIEPFTYLEFAKAVMKQWMNSPPHRANILDREQLFLGTGTALQPSKDPDMMPKIYAVQNFSDRKEGE